MRCKEHFDRAIQLLNGHRLGIGNKGRSELARGEQDRTEFDSLLKKALEIDPDARPEWRLSNLIMQRRARWLLSREDELFLDPVTEGKSR